MKNRRLLSLLSAAALAAAAFTGCGEKQDATTTAATTAKQAESTTAASTEGNDATDATDTTEEATTEATTEVSEAADKYLEMDAIEFTAAMGNGINLGNTFEAIGGERNFAGMSISDMTSTVAVNQAETLWGQPVTTQEMMDGMKAAGFDSIRIPAAWTKYMDNIATGDYTINPAFFDRVEEVINYAKNNDMIVILNDHWDGQWWAMFGSENQEDVDTAWALYESMWTQIATRFADYDSFLVFEGGNEELGNRFNDSYNGKIGKLSTDECYALLPQVTQKFVDTVRAAGGNNENRFLLIPGYNTDVEMTCDDRYAMPKDTADGKLLISVHYYTPSNYCIGGAIAYWGSNDNVEEMNTYLAKMKKFTDEGYGVVIGEWGVANEAIGNHGGAPGGIYEYFKNFLANCDLYGYAPFLWDCSNYFVRSECAWTTDEGLSDLGQFFLDAQASTAADLQANAQAVLDDVKANAHDDPNAIQDIREDESQSIAWIMLSSSDWGISYSVGDKYDPSSASAGLVPTDVIIDGEGTYTVSLDMTANGGASGVAFSALGIANGEINFPNYVIEIKEIKINDSTVIPCENYYTTADDGKCTRVNLYNAWVPDAVSAISGNKNNELGRLAPGISADSVTATPIDPNFPEKANTISITFDYYPAAE